MDLLHVVLELLDSAFVQIATEQREQIGGQAEWLDEGRAGQLPRHMENRVRPSKKEHKVKKWQHISNYEMTRLNCPSLFISHIQTPEGTPPPPQKKTLPQHYQLSKSPMLGSMGTSEVRSLSPCESNAYSNDRPNYKNNILVQKLIFSVASQQL